MIMESKQAIYYIYLLFFLLLCSYHIINIIKKLELRLLVFLI